MPEIVVSVDGKAIDTSLLTPWKHEAPMVVTPSGIVTFVSLLHLHALAPKLVVPVINSISVQLLHPSKKYEVIVGAPGTLTFFNAVHVCKALVEMLVSV